MKTHSNKNRVFELTFSSKQKSKLDTLVNALITLFVSQMPRIKYIITCIISEVVISFTTKTFCPKSVKL